MPISDDTGEFIRLEHAGEKWPIPDDLETRVHAPVVGDGIGLGRFLDTAPDAAMLLALKDVRLAWHHLAAFAKLGRHRIVKYQLEGTRGTLTLNARWKQGESGWRTGAIDPVKIQQPQPA